MAECPACGDPLYANEEWRLRPGVPPVGDVAPGDYIHERCVGKDTSNDHNP